MLLREKIIGKTERRELLPFIYGAAVTYINGIIWFVLAYILKNNGNLESNLNNYNNFAYKYVAMAFVLAVAEPVIEKVIKLMKKQ